MSGWFNYSADRQLNRRRPRFLRHALRSGGFVSVERNAAGWLAVLLPGATLGAAAAVAFGVALLPTIGLGALVAWVLAVSIDRMKDRYRLVGFHFDELSSE